MLAYLIFVVAVLETSEIAAEFPSFIHRCSKSDPNLNRCLLKNGIIAFSHIINGVPELYLPSIKNFRSGPLDYDATENIHFHSNNGVAISRNLSLSEIRFDLDTDILKFKIRIGYSKWRFDFTANGTILGKPILEKGYSNMTLYNADFSFEAKLETKTIDKVNYYQISNYINANVEIEKFKYNIFDQESVKQPITNKQQQIFEKSLPLIEFSISVKLCQVGGQMVTFILNTILMLMPESEVFLP